MPDRRLAVVAGSASGVGLATVRALQEVGTAVVGVDLAARPDGLDGVDWIQGDIAAQDTWDRVGERTDGEADAFVCCAADIVVAKFLDTPLDEWRRLFDVNVLGVIRGMHALLPPMLERRDGAVAVVCSVNSLFTEDLMSAYSTSKAALLQVVRSAALEYARFGVRINAVLPGCIDTPLLRRHLDSLDDPAAAWRDLERRSPTGRILTPDEIARALRFLVSRDASGLSGAGVVVDAGLTTTYDFAP